MKSKPYVYRCEHKDTGQFYIGYRKANKMPASEDFGIHYFSSCKFVSDNFDQFIHEILSEYDSALMAFEVEQRLIYELRHDEKLINKNFKTKNLITLDPKPVNRTLCEPMKKASIQGMPRKRSSPTPNGVKKRKRRQAKRKLKEMMKQMSELSHSTAN